MTLPQLTIGDISLHGVRLLHWRKLHWMDRIFWILVTFLASVVLGNFLYILVGSALTPSRKEAKRVHMRLDPLPAAFPAVSLCNLNPYKTDEMSRLPVLRALEAYFASLQNEIEGVTVYEEAPWPKYDDSCSSIRLPHGYVDYSKTDRSKGTVAKVACEKDYELVGAETMQCLQNFKPTKNAEKTTFVLTTEWDDELPGCLPSHCPFPLMSTGDEDARKFSTEFLQFIQSRSLNTSQEVTCAEGYSISPEFLALINESTTLSLSCDFYGAWNMASLEFDTNICVPICRRIYAHWSENSTVMEADGEVWFDNGALRCENGSWKWPVEENINFTAVQENELPCPPLSDPTLVAVTADLAEELVVPENGSEILIATVVHSCRGERS